MKKLWLLGLMLIFVLSLTSCAKLNIPDGEIKDFVSNFDGEKAFESVDYIYCQIFNTYYEGDYDDGTYQMLFVISVIMSTIIYYQLVHQGIM